MFYNISEIDLIPAFATFVCSLLIRLEVGIVVGIAINVIILLYTLARPSVHVEKQQVSKHDKMFNNAFTNIEIIIF